MYSVFHQIPNQSLRFINEWKSVGFVDLTIWPACLSIAKRKFGFVSELDIEKVVGS